MKNLRTTFEEIIIKAIASDSCRVLTTMEPYIRQLLDAVAEEMEKDLQRIDSFKVTEYPNYDDFRDSRQAWIAGQMKILLDLEQFRDEIRTRLKQVTQ